MLNKNRFGNLTLHVAIGEKCSGLVLDILSAATIAAEIEVRMEVLNPDGYYLPLIIGICSINSIEQWHDRGAEIIRICTTNTEIRHHITADEASDIVNLTNIDDDSDLVTETDAELSETDIKSENFPLKITKYKTIPTGDSSAEKCLRSLGITIPPGTPSEADSIISYFTIGVPRLLRQNILTSSQNDVSLESENEISIGKQLGEKGVPRVFGEVEPSWRRIIFDCKDTVDI